MTQVDRVHAAKVRRQLDRHGRFPITLPNAHVRRIVEKQPHILVLTRAHRLGLNGTPKLYDLHNALVIKRNAAHRHGGRLDLQSDPHVLTIELLEVTATTLGAIQLKDARAAGFATVAHLLEDWREHHRRSQPDVEVFLHRFQIEGERYLHRDIHRGYTHDPAEGVRGELAAPSVVELDAMAVDNRERFEDLRRDEMERRSAKSLAARLRVAVTRADEAAIDSILRDLEALKRRIADPA